MKVGVIGYKNHSQKIISILQKLRVNLLVYCHKKNIFKNFEKNDPASSGNQVEARLLADMLCYPQCGQDK